MNKLTQVRDVLHAQLVSAVEAAGWPAERATRYPPAQLVSPCAWVDAATLSPVGAAVGATFPLILAVDGLDQVEQLDQYMAQLYSDVRAAVWQGRTFSLVSMGPEVIDAGGPNTLAVVASVQVQLMPNTLCTDALTVSETPEEITP